MPENETIRTRLHSYARRLKASAFAAARQVRNTWRAHRDRLANDPAYGGALAGVVVAACELGTRDPRVVAVVAAVITAYITISRAAHRGDWSPDDGWPWPSRPYDS